MHCDVGPKRPTDELVALLAEQRLMLAASSEAYDRGSRWEAKRLASIVFTMVYDHGAISSLLSQLGHKEKMKFLSSGKMIDPPPGFKTVSASPALVIFKFDPPHPPKALPKFHMSSAVVEVDFETWWKDEFIFVRGGDIRLNRSRLVATLRHQDGGGHVGKLTDAAYVDLKAGGGLILASSDGTESELEGLALASMRQVAWEMTETLKKLDEELAFVKNPPA
jgi:hypothetical protein